MTQATSSSPETKGILRHSLAHPRKPSLARRIEAFRWNLKYAFSARKPLLTARLAKAVIRSSLGHPPLRYVDFSLDFRCNLRCEHCFATALEAKADRPRMALEDYKRVAKQAMDLGCVNFSFQGGEPLLIKQLPEIITACQPERNVISVTTNGLLLTEERIDQLIAAGVDILTVSLDSGEADDHDAFRGAPGAFAKSVAGIRRALKKGLRVTIGTVVMRGTLDQLGFQKLLDLTLNDLQVMTYLILPVRAGNWTGSNNLSLTAEELARIEALTASSPLIRTDFQSNLGPRGCGAVKEILYLTPYGDVLPCPFLHISPGNVLSEPLAEIRARALGNAWFADYHPDCLVSTSEAFIDDHLSRTFDAEALPLNWQDGMGERKPDPRHPPD